MYKVSRLPARCRMFAMRRFLTINRIWLCLAASMVWGGAAVEQAAAADGRETNFRRTHVVEVFETNRDAVVNVNTTTIVRQRFGLFDDDPLFRQFFGNQPFQR